MVLGRKTNFFLGKRWFWAEKPTFFLGKNQKKHLFGVWPHSFPKDGFLVFPEKKLVFSAQNHLFPRKKLVFLPKTIFFLGKTKKTILLEFGRIVSQKMFFFGFFG